MQPHYSARCRFPRVTKHPQRFRHACIATLVRNAHCLLDASSRTLPFDPRCRGCMVHSQVLVICTALMNTLKGKKGDDASMTEALEMKAMWVDVLEGLHADEGLATYWSSLASSAGALLISTPLTGMVYYVIPRLDLGETIKTRQRRRECTKVKYAV